MPRGIQLEVLTPGKDEKPDLAGAWDMRTGIVHCRCGPRKTNALFRDLRDTLELRYPACRYERVSVVGDNYRIHKAQAVEPWLAAPPRFRLLWWPTYGPRAHPIERIFGDTHDQVTRNHKRKRWRDLVAAGGRHFDRNGPWRYRLCEIYQEPEITIFLKEWLTNKQIA